MLWSVQLVRTPTNKVRVAEIDDRSWHRGQRYGTIIINLETQRMLDQVSDRNIELVRAWLAFHPQIDVTSRERCQLLGEILTNYS